MSKIAFSTMGLCVLGVLTLSVSAGCIHVERRHGPPGGPHARWASGHDQTPQEAHDIVSENPNATGTGIFVVPAPDVGPLEYTAKMVPGLTYAQCVRRGSHCPGFKFIPEELAGHNDLLEMGSGCAGRGCSGDDGVAGCANPCACAGGTCVSSSP